MKNVGHVQRLTPNPKARPGSLDPKHRWLEPLPTGIGDRATRRFRVCSVCLASMSSLSCVACVQVETLSIRISKAESKALRQRARAEKMSQGAIVRRALRAYGVTPEPEKAKTGYDVIKHLIGSCKGGSPDLSTHPKYLEGYGQ